MTVFVTFEDGTRTMRRWEVGSLELGTPEKLHMTHEAYVNSTWEDMRASFHVMRYDPPDGFATDPRVTAEYWTKGLPYADHQADTGRPAEPQGLLSTDVPQPDRGGSP